MADQNRTQATRAGFRRAGPRKRARIGIGPNFPLPGQAPSHCASGPCSIELGVPQTGWKCVAASSKKIGRPYAGASTQSTRLSPDLSYLKIHRSLVIQSHRIMLFCMSGPTDDELAKLGAAFDAFARRYKLADALSSEPMLNELDKQALLYIAAHPGCGPTDIGRFLGVPNTTISSATDRLVKRGLLQRTRTETDRRAVALQLSDAGTDRVGGLVAAHRALYRRMLEPLSPSERESLIRIVTIIVSSED